MKKRYRFLIILAVIAVGFYFVWPSVRWYFLTPQVDKDVAESSRNQIKVYAQERADEAIKKLVAMGSTDPLPLEYSYLVKKASARYKAANKAVPTSWKVQDILQAYTSRTDILTDSEDWYRSQMFALKDLKNQTMQLGLDLRGGMYVTIRMDFATLEKTSGTRYTDAQK
jgi:preprotein translocase subunit SecD